MHSVTNLFPVMGVQNLSKSVKICQSYWQKFAATFFMPHSVYRIEIFLRHSGTFCASRWIHISVLIESWIHIPNLRAWFPACSQCTVIHGSTYHLTTVTLMAHQLAKIFMRPTTTFKPLYNPKLQWRYDDWWVIWNARPLVMYGE